MNWVVCIVAVVVMILAAIIVKLSPEIDSQLKDRLQIGAFIMVIVAFLVFILTSLIFHPGCQHTVLGVNISEWVLTIAMVAVIATSSLRVKHGNMAQDAERLSMIANDLLDQYEQSIGQPLDVRNLHALITSRDQSGSILADVSPAKAGLYRIKVNDNGELQNEKTEVLTEKVFSSNN